MSQQALKRVLFVCIGNACRSPMAEGFANHYGADVLVATSAGLAPTQAIPPDTVRAMDEMNVDVSTHVPRRYEPFEGLAYDIVINMAGFKLPGPPPKELMEWQVSDPYGATLDAYRLTRNDLEQRVMRLILDLRRKAKR
ncbi:MAG TPA: arsenate reductase ArsC [Bryobacteraceae bacterium]|nr:arsenate reductase ArsC [Bryobacteraceae bacterium]